MGIIYIKFHVPNSNGLLVITTKLITKYKFHEKDILYSHILRQKFRYESYISSKDLLSYIIL
jgi:hypothetical protein